MVMKQVMIQLGATKNTESSVGVGSSPPMTIEKVMIQVKGAGGLGAAAPPMLIEKVIGPNIYIYI